MNTAISRQYKITVIIIREIPFIGYLVMTQFVDFYTIQGQLLIAYWNNSNKMQNVPMCNGDTYLV